MDLSWEAFRFAPGASPSRLLHGVGLLDLVTDVLVGDGRTVEALVRTDPVHVVTMIRSRNAPRATCTCGSSFPEHPCIHALAAWIRELQLRGGIGNARIARWEQLLASRHQLDVVWDRFAECWLGAARSGDPDEEAELMWAVDSLEGEIRVARALVGKATGDELSKYLLRLVNRRGIDGESRLSLPGIVDADQLMNVLCQPLDRADPAANASAVLAIAGSLRRTAAGTAEEMRYEWTLHLACSTIGGLVAAGHADPLHVAETILRAELAAPETSYPWIAIIFDRLSSGAAPVAGEMQRLLDDSESGSRTGTKTAPRRRLRTEIAAARGEIEDLLRELAEWPDAPYGEFACRFSALPAQRSPMPILEGARSAGRLRWAPGWPCHGLASGRGRIIHHIHEEFLEHPFRGDIAIGDLVTALADDGREDEALVALRTHARRHPEASHRYEFLRIWETAQLGPGAAGEADALFEHGDENLARTLGVLSRIPENYFSTDFSTAGRGMAAALLTAVLLEDIPPEGNLRQLQAPVWAESFFSSYPDAVDDLEHLAALPEQDLAEMLEGAVLDRDLALRAQRIARHVVSGDAGLVSASDARAAGPDAVIVNIQSSGHAGELTGALTSLFLTGLSPVAETILRPWIDQATGGACSSEESLIRRAHDAEPRGADSLAYVLGLTLAGHGEAAPPRRS
ncbi:hypothetical protein ACT3SP_08845 [Brachybacterium sp. AOP43-C2-M15]|uniref:hypothetical protein n=1 Tax=Brachybacterium sp. AOP43-C2-M15 TaxID=3457661 RepID=UPI00403454F5